MKDILKHFIDVFVVTLSYLGLIIAPLFILLNILNVCSFNNGLYDLGSIILALVTMVLSRAITTDARRAHNLGQRFLFDW